ncbi:MAG TPA: TIM barrel protein [Verrucomicrobiota bacterium]|nr:hydroxypyruvate isomerase [Verrucomicrobiales bacterium]HRI15644.1 TIM barrel protein [Verrucomicrobiota bacterium]
MKLSRRAALASSAAASVASLLHRLEAADAASGMKGHINHSVCKWCYPKIELATLAEWGSKNGLKSIELLEVQDIPTVQKYGLTCAMVSGIPGSITKGLNRLENHDKIVEWATATAPKVAALGCPNIICFSGNREGQDDELGIKNCAIGLKRLMPIAETNNVTIAMELLNSKVDHADYQCDRTPWGVELCKAVGSERFKLLYDIYHMQIMEGDVIATLKKATPYIAHYHTGGVPGRHEIDETQELFYPAIMQAIVGTGFKGYVAQEFIPSPKRDALTSLKQGVTICDV